jgi:hypothetical protein
VQSTKKVIELKDLITERIFKLPRSVANDMDPVTGEACVFVGVNGKAYYVLVEKPTAISYNAFCVLKDNGIITGNFNDGEEIK